MPDEGQTKVAEATDARTSPSAVWSILENLKGDALVAWRMADVANRASPADRNLTEPYPFGWYGLCLSTELPAGAVKPLRYFGRDLVAWRGEDGKARVLEAYCRHLGAHMGYGGRIVGNDLACPFHAWQYDDTGAVTKIPYARSIPPQGKRANCVRSFPTVERNGFVSVWYHPDNVAPLYELEAYPEVGAKDWTPLKVYEWRVFTSMRNMHDNVVDLAHFLYVHRTAEFPSSEITIDGHQMSSISRSKLGTPKGLVDGAIVSHNSNPGMGYVRFQGISETMMISATAPVGPDELHVRFAFLQPVTEAEGPMAGLARALIRDICKQLDQDKIIWDRQRYEAEPLICDGDGPIPAARDRFDQFLSLAAFENAKGKKRTFDLKRKSEA